MSKSDVDMDSEKSDERKLYKLVKNKLKDILLYVDSTSYAIASKTVSDTKIENHLITYNILRKRYNKNYGVPDKIKRKKFNLLFHWVIHKLFEEKCNRFYSKELIKCTSLFC